MEVEGLTRRLVARGILVATIVTNSAYRRHMSVTRYGNLWHMFPLLSRTFQILTGESIVLIITRS
jgi:hypothetical protein